MFIVLKLGKSHKSNILTFKRIVLLYIVLKNWQI